MRDVTALDRIARRMATRGAWVSTKALQAAFDSLQLSRDQVEGFVATLVSLGYPAEGLRELREGYPESGDLALVNDLVLGLDFAISVERDEPDQVRAEAASLHDRLKHVTARKAELLRQGRDRESRQWDELLCRLLSMTQEVLGKTLVALVEAMDREKQESERRERELAKRADGKPKRRGRVVAEVGDGDEGGR